MYLRFLYIILFSGVCFFAVAQPVINISASKSVIRTGEPDTLTLVATWPGHNLQQGFTIADSFPHFEVWDKGAAKPIVDGISQSIVVTGYDSGRFNLPPLPLANEGNYATDSFPVVIQPVNIDTLNDYHDIKDIIEVQPVSQWPFITLIALLTIGSIIGLYFFLKRKNGPQSNEKKVPKAGAYQRATEALAKLSQQANAPGPAKPFFVALTSIYRNYLSEAYHWRSLQQTGGELILQAKPLLNETDFYQLTNAIRLSDAVKFAKYEPQNAEWQNALTAIRQTIDTLEKQLQQQIEHDRFKPQGTGTKK